MPIDASTATRGTNIAGPPQTMPAGWRVAARTILRRHTAGALGGLLCLLIALVTVLAPWIRPYDPLVGDTAHLLQSPTFAHPFGTDAFGRDLLSRVLLGGQPTLLASLCAVILATAAGLLIGTVAGYARGLVDVTLMRLMDVLLSFPFILLALVLVAALGPGLFNLIIAIAVTQIPVFARLCRALALSIRATTYVDAAIAVGVGHGRIIWRHMVPNMAGPVVVQAATTMGLAIGLVSAFNFLGLGIQPPTPDGGIW